MNPRPAPSTWRPTPNDPADWFPAEQLDRARRYQRPLRRMRALRTAVATAVVAAFAFGGVGAVVLDASGADGWVERLLVLALALQVAALAYDVPIDAWVDLVHDRRWAVSTQTGRGFVSDQARSFVLTAVTNVVLLVPLYALVRGTGLWWLWGWALVMTVAVAFGFLHPIVIAPLFNRFTPLAPGDLADRVAAVARAAGVDIHGTLVADESRRSARHNAYVAGLGSTRRVVLFDTLLAEPPEAVEQVVAHEIGHWRRHHVRRQVLVAAAGGLAVAVGLYAVEQWAWLLARADLGPEAALGDPASLPLLLLTAQVGAMVAGFAGAFVSRAFERQADEEALVLLGDPDGLVEMHRRLHVQNLADLDPGPLAYLGRTHPPAAERMAFARAWAAHRGPGAAGSGQGLRARTLPTGPVDAIHPGPCPGD